MKCFKCFFSAAAALFMAAAPVSAEASAFSVNANPVVSVYTAAYDCAEFTNFNNIDDAIAYVRENIKNRKNILKFSLPMKYVYDKAFHDILLGSVEETNSGKEGDYIKYNLKSIDCRGGYDGVRYYYTINLEYLTSAEQEQFVDNSIKEIIQSLNPDGLSDYEKISAVYEYIIQNVDYDYSDSDNPEHFTAYGAIYNGKAVCQGYSQLFYRLCKELGISCRIISGTARGSHAWNIVELDGLYYLADPTWDYMSEESSECDYFLKGSLDFDDADKASPHVATGVVADNFLITDFTSDEFKREYPISDYSYNSYNNQPTFMLGDVNSDGSIDSTDASLVLEIYAGQSTKAECHAKASQLSAADVNGDECVNSSDASALLSYYGYTSTGGKLSLGQFLRR